MFSIAIDGPAGSGKSTVAKRVAKLLTKRFRETIYVDTGAIYRSVAYFLLKEYSQEEIEKEEFVAKVINEAIIRLRFIEGVQSVYLGDKDISLKIRTEEVSRLTSKIAGFLCVRNYLINLQKKLAKDNNVVMDGRDIGTCILPEATLKIFLIASVDIRATRRFLELEDRGEAPRFEDIKKEIAARDERDMTREIAPLKKAEDAVELDTSELSIDEVSDKIIGLFKEKMNV